MPSEILPLTRTAQLGYLLLVLALSFLMYAFWEARRKRACESDPFEGPWDLVVWGAGLTALSTLSALVLAANLQAR